MENVDLNNNEERNETDSGKNERIVANKRMQWPCLLGKNSEKFKNSPKFGKSRDRNDTFWSDNIERKHHWLVDYNNNEHKWDIMMVKLILWIIIGDNWNYQRKLRPGYCSFSVFLAGRILNFDLSSFIEEDIHDDDEDGVDGHDDEEWVNCYCWGNSSILEGRFSKWF